MDQFNQLLRQTGEYGIVYQVSHPIVFIEGLPTVKTQEVIMFETGQKAEVFSINRGKIEARSFAHEPIRVGTKVTKTGQLLSVPVGDELLGHTIDPLGEPLDPAVEFIKPKIFRTLDATPVGIAGRAALDTPMITGTALIDLMIPLGRGQRELVIGDRKTGKTSFILTAIKNQVHEGIIVIYAAIGKKKSDIKRLQEFFIQEKIMDKIIIVATSSYSSPSIIYQTPYAAMAIAEYYKERGQHTLIVFDDLSTHAKFYRELSLLARRFPGRDSYPGDIFYIHSKLLERAGMFKHPTKGKVAISCFPVMEIVEGDLTGYVSTNVMGITDGHIYFDSNIYYQGMRPAVNIPLSVTRVGRQVSDKLTRDVNKNLTIFLSKYEKLLNLSHFGQELTEDTKKNLRTGDLINEFFKQPYQLTIPLNVQLIIISMLLQGIIDSKESLANAKKNLIKAFYVEDPKKFLLDLAIVNDLKAFNERIMKNKDALLELIKNPEKPPAHLQVVQTPPQQTPPPAGGQQSQTTAQQPSQPTPQPLAQTGPITAANTMPSSSPNPQTSAGATQTQPPPLPQQPGNQSTPTLPTQETKPSG
jgi:F-type H+-transporting ATPase subunit alpha